LSADDGGASSAAVDDEDDAIIVRSTRPRPRGDALEDDDDVTAVRLLPIRPLSRCELHSLRTFPVVTLHPRFPFNV
jgi:hypothetical protein